MRKIANVICFILQFTLLIVFLCCMYVNYMTEILSDLRMACLSISVMAIVTSLAIEQLRRYISRPEPPKPFNFLDELNDKDVS